MARLMFVTGSLAFGGAERHSITLMNRLAERGHECHAVYVKNAAQQLDRIRLRGAGGIRCLNARRYFDSSAVADFASHIRRIDPAVMVAANPYALMYCWLARRQSGMHARIVVTFHSTLLPGAKEWLQMLYYRPLFWGADCLVFICKAQQRHWRRRLLTARRTEIIYNGVDLAHWQPLSERERGIKRTELGFTEDDFVIGMCAVFRPEKNHLQLVEAVAALRKQGIPARALLIGDGDMRPTIEARACALGVAHALVITGFQNDVRPFIAAADIVVLCSTSVETLSLAALEAMALCRPMVLSDIGGAAEMITPGANGYLFRAGDTTALIQQLALLADRSERVRMGRRAREKVETVFSEEEMIDRYDQTLQQLAGATLQPQAPVTT
jgi:glycosyltransferase involved in cell wall biosynthesis